MAAIKQFKVITKIRFSDWSYWLYWCCFLAAIGYATHRYAENRNEELDRRLEQIHSLH